MSNIELIISFRKNIFQFDGFVREVVYADTIDARIESFDLQSIDQHMICEFRYNIILEFEIGQPLGQPLRQLFTIQLTVSHKSLLSNNFGTIAVTLSLLT